MSASLLALAQWGILIYFFALNGIQLSLILQAALAIRRHQDSLEADEPEAIFESNFYTPITLICPVYNEAAGVVASVNSLLALRYPELQVVVVNDGSKDGTLAALIEAFRLQPSERVIRRLLPTHPVRGVYESPLLPHLVVVDKANGGKSDALNCGINVARYPLVCCMDGDSILEPDALLRVVRPFLDRADLVASGGIIRPANGCKVTPLGIEDIGLPASWLARFQIVEYLRAFLFGRVGMAARESLFILSGAFALFRKEAPALAGGFETGTIGEDFEMVVRLQRAYRERKRPCPMALVPDPICWTEVPEDRKMLGRQRNRWQRGLCQTLWKHRRMAFHPGYGRAGLVSIPYFILFEAMAPWVEAVGYGLFVWSLWTHSVNGAFAILFLLVAFLFGTMNSVAAVFLQILMPRRYRGLRAMGILLLASLLENFGYRQLTVWWRLKGTLDWLRGRQGWGDMARKGLASS